MNTDSMRFECPSCGQRISATTDLVGSPGVCPTCNSSFIIPALVTTPSTSAAKPSHSHRNPLIVPCVVLLILLVSAFGGGAFYLYRSRNQINTHSPPTQQPSVTLQPTSPAPPQSKKAIISEETKNRVLTVIEKASRLRVMTEQGVEIDSFKAQLSDVTGAWESVTTLGMPKQLETENKLLATSLAAWTLALEIWSDQMGSKPTHATGENVLFILRAGSKYGDRFDAIVAEFHECGIEPPDFTKLTDKPSFAYDIMDQYSKMTHRLLADMEAARGTATLQLKKRFFDEATFEIEKLANEALGPEAETLLGIKASTALIDELAPGKPAPSHPPKMQQATRRILRPDPAIQWCFTAAATSLDRAKTSFSAHIKQEQ